VTVPSPYDIGDLGPSHIPGKSPPWRLAALVAISSARTERLQELALSAMSVIRWKRSAGQPCEPDITPLIKQKVELSIDYRLESWNAER